MSRAPSTPPPEAAEHGEPASESAGSPLDLPCDVPAEILAQPWCPWCGASNRRGGFCVGTSCAVKYARDVAFT